MPARTTRSAKGWTMSSATSIKRDDRSFRLNPDVTRGVAEAATGVGHDGAESKAKSADEGFRPWHFFVLASLVASTVAVIISRRAAPEHLILISLTIGAAGAAAAAVYRTVLPLVVKDTTLLKQRPSERARAALEREKGLVLRSIKELEFDQAMGKVSAKDFDEMAGRLRARAIALMKQLDAGGSGYREVIERELSARLKHDQQAQATPAEPLPGECNACRTVNDLDAAFCKRCGTALGTVH
jgi:hypothetical protein